MDDSLWEEVGCDELPPRHCTNCGEELDQCECPKQLCDNVQCPCHWEDEDE